MSRKLIFILFIPVLGLTYEMKKNWTSCSENMTSNMWSYGFKIKKTNKVRKSWVLSWCDDIIHGGCGKNLRRFRTFCHIGCLEIKASQRKDRSVEQDSLRFGVKVTVELWFDYKTFCIGYREQRLLQVSFW